VLRGTKLNIAVATDKPEQIPDLFLTTVVASPLTPDPILWHFVSKPVPGAGDDTHVVRTKTDLLFEFAKHGLLRRFTALDATLRKLPRMFADALAPKHLVTPVQQDDADVGAVAVFVQHVDWPCPLECK